MEYDIGLDRVHELLDGLECDLGSLQAELGQEEQVDPASLPHICDAAQEIFGLWSGYGSDMATRLHVPPALINSFVRTFRSVYATDATILASKLISYLKSVEGEYNAVANLDDSRSDNLPRTAEDPQRPPAAATKSFNASVWAPIPEADEIKAQIAQISLLLDSVVRLARTTNLPEEERSLSAIERAELIAILETALLILKAPLAEKSLLDRASEQLKRTAGKVAAKKTETALGQLADEAARALWEFISQFPWNN